MTQATLWTDESSPLLTSTKDFTSIGKPECPNLSDVSIRLPRVSMLFLPWPPVTYHGSLVRAPRLVEGENPVMGRRTACRVGSELSVDSGDARAVDIDYFDEALSSESLFLL